MERLLGWLEEATCNFQAVKVIKRELEAKGFHEIKQNEEWKIEAGGKYYMVKNGSAIFAFTTGKGVTSFKNGVRIIAAHSDSPGLKLKPNPEIIGDGGVVTLNVEKYGGGILYTWFDRPLSMSGRITVRGEGALKPKEILFDLKRPVAVIPHLAIHFNREVNSGNPISVQQDMKPVVGYFTADEIRTAMRGRGFVLEAVAKECGVDAEDILEYEIWLYPYLKPQLCGLNEEYIESPRIDDLSMVFAGLEAMLDTCDEAADYVRCLAIFDNEETGSGTRQGAASPVFRDLLERMCHQLGGSKEDFHMGVANSFMISADDAHAWHPNYDRVYDPTNHPVIGGGPVIKINANGKYMTDAYGSAVFKRLCVEAGVDYQMFVNHSDMAGGSTLGNILTAQLDLNGVDVGSAIWAMHSAVETAGVCDHQGMVKVFERFWK